MFDSLLFFEDKAKNISDWKFSLRLLHIPWKALFDFFNLFKLFLKRFFVSLFWSLNLAFAYSLKSFASFFNLFKLFLKRFFCEVFAKFEPSNVLHIPWKTLPVFSTFLNISSKDFLWVFLKFKFFRRRLFRVYFEVWTCLNSSQSMNPSPSVSNLRKAASTLQKTQYMMW